MPYNRPSRSYGTNKSMKAKKGTEHEVPVDDAGRGSDHAGVKAVKVSPTSERILQDVKRRRAVAMKILADR